MEAGSPTGGNARHAPVDALGSSPAGGVGAAADRAAALELATVACVAATCWSHPRSSHQGVAFADFSLVPRFQWVFHVGR